MSGSTESNQSLSGKADKKVAKAQAKAEKKRAAARAQEAKHAVKAKADARLDTGPSGASLTPAERSAAAAERQVRLQRYRVMIALLTMLVAAATLLLTLRNWNPWSESISEPSDSRKLSNTDHQSDQSKEPS